HEGDYIEFGLTGAYGGALATRFNGFGEYIEAEVEDAPMTTMFGAPAKSASKVVAMARPR
ncbi:MAG TPA: hypothetical protein P5072_15515, partial [Parvularculaceae bacterium]|nr:hypothetical protein [Parvularculaceae bacterium]